jgi:hypothetical protein
VKTDSTPGHVNLMLNVFYSVERRSSHETRVANMFGSVP